MTKQDAELNGRRAIDGVRLVVMDMAGTTVAITDEVPAALEEAFRSVGLQLPAGVLADLRGRSKREAVRALLDQSVEGPTVRDELADRVHDAFRQSLRRRVGGRVAEVPGAGEVIRWLRSRGIAVVLTTGFDRELTDLILQSLGWDSGDVTGTVCADDVRAGRPAPDLILRAMAIAGVDDPRGVIAVGDTDADLQAAKNAGVAGAVGVLSGAHGRDRLAAAPHTVLLDSVAALRTWLFAERSCT